MTKEELHRLFDYDANTGSLIYKTRRRGRGSKHPGDIAGTPQPDGRLMVMIKGKRHPTHRLIWMWHRGDIPKGWIVAFRDGDKTNTRFENLELRVNDNFTKSVKIKDVEIKHSNKKDEPELPSWMVG